MVVVQLLGEGCTKVRVACGLVVLQDTDFDVHDTSGFVMIWSGGDDVVILCHS